jgi:spermidine/putrescine transport system substrate-binding protein
MRRRTLFFLALTGLAGCRRSRKPRLNVMNWSEYVDPATVPAFEKEFGVEVRYGVFESNEEMLARVFSGNSGWDVVFPSSPFITPMRENSLLAPLDRSRLPGLAGLSGTFAAPPWDEYHEWCVPYQWGCTGIVYNRRLDPKPDAWADLWEPRLKGRLTMLDDPADTIGVALKKLGLSLNSADRGELEQAKAELLRQKPLVRAYLNSEARDQLVAGDLLASHTWLTTALLAMSDSNELEFVQPREGFGLYCDNAAILRESGSAELAHEFINYLLRPGVSAANAAYSRTSTPIDAARRLLPASLRDNPHLYPRPEVLARGEWNITLPPAAQRLRDRIWTEIKSA